MQRAPSVSHPVGRCRLVGLMLLVAAICGIGMQTLWIASQPSFEPGNQMAWWVGAATWYAVLIHAARRWWHTPRGLLTWTPGSPANDDVRVSGQALTGWSWRSTAYPQPVSLGQVQVTLRLNHAVLLRAKLTNGSTLWACVQCSGDRDNWSALMRALKNHAD